MAVRIGGNCWRSTIGSRPTGIARPVLGLMNGWIDITERERLARQLREAMRQADEANRAKSVFLATMSHEIPYADECGHRHPELVLQRLARSSANAPRWRSPTRQRGRCNCSSATSSTSPRSSPVT